MWLAEKDEELTLRSPVSRDAVLHTCSPPVRRTLLLALFLGTTSCEFGADLSLPWADLATAIHGRGPSKAKYTPETIIHPPNH